MENISEKKDNLVNIFFALMKANIGHDDEIYVTIDDLKDALANLVKMSDHFPMLHYYDMPDLSVTALKRNRHVDYVSLDNEVAFNMDLEEAKKIIDRNQDVATILATISTIEVFNEDLMQLSNGKMVFNCSAANTEYDLGDVYNGPDHNINKLYTDGKVEILEKTNSSTKVKVSNATYVIYAAYENNKLEGAVFQTNLINPKLQAFFMFEARDFLRGNRTDYFEEKPNILRKKGH